MRCLRFGESSIGDAGRGAGIRRALRRPTHQQENEGDQGVDSALGNHHEEGRLEALAGVQLLEQVFLQQREVAEGEEDSAHRQGEFYRPRDWKGSRVATLQVQRSPLDLQRK